MKRKLSFILAFVLLISLSGCNGKEPEQTEVTEPTGTFVTDPTGEVTDPTEPTEAVPATQAPTEMHTTAATQAPTQAPTQAATVKPTQAPTEKPTEAPTQKPTQAPTQKPTQAPTQKATQATTQPIYNETATFKYVKSQNYDNVPVYFKSYDVFVQNCEGEYLPELKCDGKVFSWGNPIQGMFVLSKGVAYCSSELGSYDYDCYEVVYNGDVGYVNINDVHLEGSEIEAPDGKTHKLGEILYNGAYHDIVIGGNGGYCCTDGCDGTLGIWASNPMFSTLETVCEFADSSYVDPNTFIEYPLCFKPIYEGKYGTVYCIANETDENSNCYKGFHVVRNKEYRKMTIDDITDPSLKEKLISTFGVKANFDWYESVAIYTFENAKLQADSYEDVCGGRHFTYIGIAGG